MQGYLQGLSSRFSPPSISFPKSPVYSTTPPTTPPSSPVFSTTPVVKEKKKFSGYGLTEQENNLIISKFKEFRKGNEVFVIPHLKKLVDVFLKDMDEMDDNMLSQFLETINPMLTQSKMDLQYLEQRGREIEDLIEKGKKRMEQKRRNQAKTPTTRKSRKNRKTRRR